MATAVLSRLALGVALFDLLSAVIRLTLFPDGRVRMNVGTINDAAFPWIDLTVRWSHPRRDPGPPCRLLAPDEGDAVWRRGPDVHFEAWTRVHPATDPTTFAGEFTGRDGGDVIRVSGRFAHDWTARGRPTRAVRPCGDSAR
ncbi:MAG: hypothetical protein FJZ92_12395 [Chloroflexi bacterium]|nr:hypothetical protein [Chloroflexota bacterium]